MDESIISTKTLDELKNIGLNLYERKIYVALISKCLGSAREIAEIANIPRSRAYDVLESLADRGFAIIQNTKPLKYVAVSPEIAIKKQSSILRKNLDINLKRIKSFTEGDSLKELKDIHSKGLTIINQSDISGSLKGRQSFNLHLKGMISSANKTIDIITTPEGLKNLYENHTSTLKKANNAGINIRIITPVTSKNFDIIKNFSSFIDLKQTKESDTLPAGNMLIIDNDQTIMGLTDDTKTHSSQDVSFWTASDHFSGNFSKNIFNIIWKQTD